MLIDRTALTAEPLLTAEEEVVLALEIEAGVLARAARCSGVLEPQASEQELILLERLGERARQRYISANLRLVAKIAAEAAARSRLAEGDLFQEGCLGLISAVERFDCRRGYRFSTYASFWVRAYVGAATANQCGALNLPTSRAHQLRALRAVEVELSLALGRTVSTAEVAASVGRTERWTAEVLAHQAPQSLDASDQRALEVASSVWVEPDLDDGSEQVGAGLLLHLHGLEREVLALRYGFADGTAHTYPEIGRRLQVTISRARRLEQRALETLRSVCPSSARLQLHAL
jgi:RNA polymerase sigma factor (sigma-70 family)